MTKRTVKTKKIYLAMAGVGLSLLATGAWAEEAASAEGGHLMPHQTAGLTIGGGTTWVMQGTDGYGTNDGTDLTYTLDLTLEGQVSKSGKVFIALEAGNGGGVDGRLGSLSTANYDAFITEISTADNSFNAPSISQIYYEGRYYHERLVVNFGKLDVHSFYDDNAYANDETDQFLAGIFSRTAGTVYAELDQYYAPGLALTAGVTDHMEVMFVVANGNGSGFDAFLDHPYAALQFTFKVGQDNSAGHYRVYSLVDARAGFYTDLSSGSEESNVAWGVSLDQALGAGFGVFARYAAQDDKLAENLVKSAWSLGAAFNGTLWTRPDDVIGIAYGLVQVNDQAGVAGLAANPGDEGHWELYYKWGISEHFTVTPSVQVIENNGGDADVDTVAVYGVRGQFNF